MIANRRNYEKYSSDFIKGMLILKKKIKLILNFI